MVAANPFKPKNKPDISSLDLTKIIEEEKTHNHAETTDKITESPFVKKDEKLDIQEQFQNKKVEPVEPAETVEDEIKETVSPAPVKEEYTLPRLDDFENANSVETASPVVTDDYQAIPIPVAKDDELVDPANEIPSAQKPLLPLGKRMKKWCWRHRWLIVVLLLIIATFVVGYIADRELNRVELNTATGGLRITYDKDKKGDKLTSELPVRVLAYNADIGSDNELLYYTDVKAVANPDGTLDIAWDIPREQALNRGTYNEFCILDESRANSTANKSCGGQNNDDSGQNIPTNAIGSTYSAAINSASTFNRISCAYYVPPRTNGLIAFLSGWNRLDDSQKVGCEADDGVSWSDSSYVDNTETSMAEKITAKDDETSDSSKNSDGGTVYNDYNITNKTVNEIIANSVDTKTCYVNNTIYFNNSASVIKLYGKFAYAHFVFDYSGPTLTQQNGWPKIGSIVNEQGNYDPDCFPAKDGTTGYGEFETRFGTIQIYNATATNTDPSGAKTWNAGDIVFAFGKGDLSSSTFRNEQTWMTN